MGKNYLKNSKTKESIECYMKAKDPNNYVEIIF